MSDEKRVDASSGKTHSDAYGIADTSVDTLNRADTDGQQLRLHGVDHTARPTWKLRETVEFYRDILGLPLVHMISARGWGPPGHHDFLHFFFDSGAGSTIAFFYYIGSEQPAKYEPEQHHFYAATHTAWTVESEDELQQWKTVLEGRGLKVSPYTRHEILESIYFLDPNGYPIEITRRLRDIARLDAEDAKLSIEAALQIEDEAGGAGIEDIDTVWRRKAKLVQDRLDRGGGMIRVYVLDVPEFTPLVDTARTMEGCRVIEPRKDYYVIEADTQITFNRKAMKMKPAVWYGIFTGGLEGEIDHFGRDEVRVIGTNRAL